VPLEFKVVVKSKHALVLVHELGNGFLAKQINDLIAIEFPELITKYQQELDDGMGFGGFPVCVARWPQAVTRLRLLQIRTCPIRASGSSD
jgi:hypothetical protein